MALSYSKTHTTSMMRRLTCTRDGDFNSMTWYKEGSGSSGGFTVTGDTSEANRFSKVTVKTPQVTATGWSSLGSTSYRVYCTLHTSFGDYRTPTTTLTWDEDNGNRTLTFTFDNVLGEWTHFSVWANQDTYTTTNGPYLYWFNNNSGTITVTYAESTNSDENTMSGIGANGEGKWVAGKYYVWKTTNPTTYIYPEAAMTAYSSQNCTASASSEVNTNDRAWKAFDKTIGGYPWSSKGSSVDAEPWLQIIYPKKLFNIKLYMWNRAYDTLAIGPISGSIYGSEDGGTTFTKIKDYSGLNPAAQAKNIINCGNTTIAYNAIKITFPTHGTTSSSTCVSLGEVYIEGTDISSSNGAWVEANPLVWKTENPKTYTYPSAAMSSCTSQGCVVISSTAHNYSTHSPFKAFDKNAENNWASREGYDPQPWIQITIPRPLYNISVQINNDASSARGPVDGIIYGSNDFGTTLTQIGSFSGRSSAKGVSTTTQCNNTTTAYNTIRVLITTLPSGYTNVDIGEIYISGTDIGTNGGWANLKEKTINPIVIYPKAAMTSNISQDCILTSSGIYNSSYEIFKAFNKNWTDNGWISKESSDIHWLSITFPEPLYNIVIALVNRGGTSGGTGGFSAGDFYGTTDGGATWTKVVSFSGRDNSTRDHYTSHLFNNKTTAYNGIKLVSANGGTRIIAELEVYGTKKP